MIDKATLDDLYATKGSRRASKGTVFKRTAPGELEKESIFKMGDFDLGRHAGKQGSIRRSRKGRTRRLPNGSRAYMSPYIHGNPIIAYSLKRG